LQPIKFAQLISFDGAAAHGHEHHLTPDEVMRDAGWNGLGLEYVKDIIHTSQSYL
jgi:hypothetical protein